MPSQSWIRLGAVSAMLGGACWIVKAVVILGTGDQPPLFFEVAPIFFGLGLVGLHARIGERGGLPRRIGLALAITSSVLAVASLIFESSTSSEEDFSPMTFGAFLANLGGLIFLGVATRRTNGLQGKWKSLPLAMGISTFPMMAVGGALSSINERLLEVPLTLLGVAWIWLGYLIMTSADQNSSLAPT